MKFPDRNDYCGAGDQRMRCGIDPREETLGHVPLLRESRLLVFLVPKW